MHLQACCIYVSFIAVGTLIRLVLVVLTPVRLGQKVYLKKKKKGFQLCKVFCETSIDENVTFSHWIRRKQNSVTPVNLRVV